MKFASKSAAALAFALVLTACGGGADDDDADDVEDAAAPAATETAAIAGASETPAPDATPSGAASASPAPTPSPAPTVAAASAAATAPAAFAVCAACHSVVPGDNGIGPSLAGIWGEKAGEVDGFDFSEAMEDSGLVWNQATLDRYLTDPKGVVPGNKMPYGGLKDAAKRQAVIDYIRSL